MYRPISISATMGTGTFPNNFISEALWPEHRIHQYLEVVASSRVTVQVEAPRRLEHPA